MNQKAAGFIEDIHQVVLTGANVRAEASPRSLHLPGEALIPRLGMEKCEAEHRFYHVLCRWGYPASGDDHLIRQPPLRCSLPASGSRSPKAHLAEPGSIPPAGLSCLAPDEPFPESGPSLLRCNDDRALWPKPLFELKVLGTEFGHYGPQLGLEVGSFASLFPVAEGLRVLPGGLASPLANPLYQV
jgi:hypothetical protein